MPFFFNDTATTEIYTLSLHDALPISWPSPAPHPAVIFLSPLAGDLRCMRSEEHTSELQSRSDLVCRLLLEKKKPEFVYFASEANSSWVPGERVALLLCVTTSQ